jgi:hypothetical protein
VLDRSKYRLGLQHHPVTTAERAVIDHPMLIGSKRANIVNVYFDDVRQPCTAYDPKIKDLSEKIRKNC